jgi:hypothetical protein
MLGRVFVFGRIAAADMAAFETETQVNPRVAGGEALSAAIGSFGGYVSDLVKMQALCRHDLRPPFCFMLPGKAAKFIGFPKSRVKSVYSTLLEAF